MPAKHIEELLRRKIGLHVESIGEAAFERAVSERMAACGAFSEDGYLGHLHAQPAELERLIEQVVVHESWFFREPAALDLLCARATAAARTPARPFRVLSLPCASGEEPYSVAIMLLLAGLLPGTFEVTGIDVSASAVEAARRGVYSDYAFRGGVEKLGGYVESRVSGTQVSAEVRKLVGFAQGNVLDPLLLPGAQFDAVLCRNLLIYLDGEARAVAMRTILRLLAEDGVLFTGHAESGIALDHGLRKVGDPRSFAFERGKRASLRPKAKPQPKAPAPIALPTSRRAAVTPPPRAAARIARKSSRPASPARPGLDEARSLADRGDLEGARGRCEAYLAVCGPEPAAYCLLAVVKEAAGDIDGAIDAFGKALYLDAEQLDALLHLALLHERRGELDTARTIRRRAERVQRPEERVTDPRALPVLPVVNDCWNRIGVRGDRTCPELPSVIHCHNCRVFTAAAQTLLDRPAARDYLAELSEFVSEPIAKRKLADCSAVLVRIGGEHFAIATSAVQEVAEVAPPRRVPHRGNRVFEGLVNVRGQLELCVSVAGVLGVPRREQDQAQTPCALIVMHAGQRWVLLIDAVLGVQRFHQSQLIEPPAASRRSDTPYVTALVPHEGEHFGWLDIARLCGDLADSVRGVAARGEAP